MKLFRKLFNKNLIRNRKVNRSRFLYYYIIFSPVAMFLYFVVSVFMGWAKWLTFTPVYITAGFILLLLFKRFSSDIWFYVIDKDRGRLRLHINKTTHWSKEHKNRVVKWVYPKNNEVRKEVHDNVAQKLYDNKELTIDEKKLLSKKVVFLPQQVSDGVNEMLLADALVYAHKNILPLDDELRELKHLTDNFMIAFSLQDELEKATGLKYEKLMEIGKRKSEEIKTS